MMNSKKTPPWDDPDIQTDIVVVGGGGAGLTAAVSAAEAGAKNILILEARNKAGGNAAMISGIFGAESRLQKSLGIDADRDVLFRKSMDYSHWKNDPKLVRSLVDNSADNIAWLEEKGIPISIVPSYPNQDPPTFHMCRKPNKIGASFYKQFTRLCEEAGIEIRRNTRARRLLIGNDGGIEGVEAEADGRTISVKAKCVILATGGFAGNESLIRQYLPDFNSKDYILKGIPHMGDGLLMALEAGADTDGMVVLEMRGPEFPWSAHLARFIRRPVVVWVNKEGERFADESILDFFPDSANTLCRQPGKISYTLFDEVIKQHILNGGVNLIEELITGATEWSNNLDDDFLKQIKRGEAKMSDSWDEIADWIGANSATLGKTLEHYNNACAKGHDGQFAKHRKHLIPLNVPPFYAMKCRIVINTTHGGIKINEYSQVLDKNNHPIKGLHAAGAETGGTDSDTYDINLPGHAFAVVINTGRIAGRVAALSLK